MIRISIDSGSVGSKGQWFSYDSDSIEKCDIGLQRLFLMIVPMLVVDFELINFIRTMLMMCESC